MVCLLPCSVTLAVSPAGQARWKTITPLSHWGLLGVAMRPGGTSGQEVWRTGIGHCTKGSKGMQESCWGSDIAELGSDWQVVGLLGRSQGFGSGCRGVMPAHCIQEYGISSA